MFTITQMTVKDIELISKNFYFYYSPTGSLPLSFHESQESYHISVKKKKMKFNFSIYFCIEILLITLCIYIIIGIFKPRQICDEY